MFIISSLLKHKLSCHFALLILTLFCSSNSLACAVAEPESADNWLIDDTVLISPEPNVQISVLTVRPRNQSEPLPIALNFTIYAEENRMLDIDQATEAAKQGYIGVIAYSRGKHLSKSEKRPYETEVNDVNAVIDWLARQPWGNGSIGMYGGSYEGFTQWAATKKLHPALKTIVPYVAAIPGLGLPMENNVFLNANYGWAFHVTNNQYKDNRIYEQRQRWNDINQAWYKSGQSYRSLDSFDERPNPFFQKWLRHPSYDSYWQAMVPYKSDYANIDIPILSITGYYDDAQVSALHYFNEHYRFNPDANHYLIIGPYDHFTAQTGAKDTLRGITIEPVAKIDVKKITFEWFDYILKNGKRPAIIKDKINYQPIGHNKWMHASSMAAFNSTKQTFYLSSQQENNIAVLSRVQPTEQSALKQQFDMRDRGTQNQYYPWPIESKNIDIGDGILFLSEPFESQMELSGQWSALLKVKTNKQDFDISLVLYEQMADGRFFNLGYYLGRASYADNMSKRNLLVPEQINSVSVARTKMISKVLQKGSRIGLLVAVNKNNFAQINYGTGKDVSAETIEDANEALIIEWLNTSRVRVPLTEFKEH